ncbi:MAG: universal stress protein [Leptospirales bacterium]
MPVPFRTVAFPIDLTPIDAETVSTIRTFLSSGVEELHVFHVLNVFNEIPTGYPIPFEYYREIDLSAAREVRRIADHFCVDQVNVTVGIYRGKPDQTILEVSAEQKSDLILLISQGKGVFGRIFMGSTSTSVLHNAPIPVLLLKPDQVNKNLIQHSARPEPPINIFNSLLDSGEVGQQI